MKITQRTYEWRSKFASTAIEAVIDLEASDSDYEDADFRADWVSWALDEKYLPFLYADTESDDPQVCVAIMYHVSLTYLLEIGVVGYLCFDFNHQHLGFTYNLHCGCCHHQATEESRKETANRSAFFGHGRGE